MNNDEAAGASVEFVVPKDLVDGYVNNKLENYKFRSVYFTAVLLWSTRSCSEIQLGETQSPG